ncbi:MAG: type II secretion system protein [Rhodocyclaceae bacterium]|nr:MAG: type II secretion system protein [Rhodocyclaceae bacterium]
MSSRRGFTLIELLVAISLATIITLLGVSLMRTGINSSVANEEALIQSQGVRDARRLIEHAWSGRQSIGFSGSDAQIEFTSSQAALGGLPLRFACQPGEKGDYALWLYRTMPADQPGQPQEPAGEMLLGSLGECKFGFLRAPADDRQPAQWKGDWPAGQGPPALLRLDLASLRGTLPPFILAAGAP